MPPADYFRDMTEMFMTWNGALEIFLEEKIFELELEAKQ